MAEMSRLLRGDRRIVARNRTQRPSQEYDEPESAQTLALLE
jgi:hypothetical protein